MKGAIRNILIYSLCVSLSAAEALAQSMRIEIRSNTSIREFKDGVLYRVVTLPAGTIVEVPIEGYRSAQVMSYQTYSGDLDDRAFVGGIRVVGMPNFNDSDLEELNRKLQESPLYMVKEQLRRGRLVSHDSDSESRQVTEPVSGYSTDPAMMGSTPTSGHLQIPSPQGPTASGPMISEVAPADQVSSDEFQRKVTAIASASSCGRYHWLGRGRAPAGYTKGMALSFARGLCRVRAANLGDRSAPIFKPTSTNMSSSSDVLNNYFRRGKFTGRPQTPQDALRATYTIAMGLGMRESSGKYCEGWDRSASSKRSRISSRERGRRGEGGVFQSSYDAMSLSPELKRLYEEYKAHPERCMRTVFKEGVSCSKKNWIVSGSGAGAEFQHFSKICPAFATEFAVVLMRLTYKHYGPLIRGEAQMISSCSTMFKNVQELFESDVPSSFCGETVTNRLADQAVPSEEFETHN